jgi:hypothetical protein
MASSMPTTMTTTIPAAPTAMSSFLSIIESTSLSLRCYISCSISSYGETVCYPISFSPVKSWPMHHACDRHI